MTKTAIPIKAPQIGENYPYEKSAIAPAWQQMWTALRASTGHLNGRDLAAEVAPQHNLNPATLVGLLSRAAKVGLLEREQRHVETTILRNGAQVPGKRNQTFYRIKN